MKEGRFPNLSNLNKGKDIVFDIFMRNDYPFSSPRVYCATEVYADYSKSQRHLTPNEISI
jgi:ubiquitin-protein ligase